MTLVHADNIDIASVAALLQTATVTQPSRYITGFIDSITALKTRNSFQATWTVLRTATTGVDKPWVEATKLSTDYTVDILRATGNSRSPASFRKQTTARDTGNVTLDSTCQIYMFPPLPFEPSLEDSISFGGETYRIVSIEKVTPGETTLLYMIGLTQ